MFSFLKASPDASTKVPAEKVKSTYVRKQVGVVLATCVTYMAYYIIRLIFTTEQQPVMKAYGFNLSQIGLILSTFGIGYGISKLFMGGLADKSNTKRFLAFGLYLSGIFNAFLAFTHNFYIILGLMLLISVTQAIGAPACQREISLWFSKKHRGTMFAIWASAHNAGAFACVACIQIATFLFSGSLPAVFLTASVVSAVIATLMLLINSERPETEGLPSMAEYSGHVELDENGQSTSQELSDKSFWQILLHDILTNKIVWAVTLTSMSIYIVRYGVMSWIPSYLPTKGFSIDWAKWLVGIFELSAVPGVIIFGSISDFLKGRRSLVCLVCVVAMIACLVTYFTSNNKAVIVAVLFIMGSLIYAPLALVGLMVNEAVPNYALGLSTGFMGFFQYVFGETAATALIGNLVNKYGWGASATTIYVASGLALVLLVYLVIKEHKILAMEMKINQ
ncbi:MFS transporter [Weissella confusa]|uniref:MFS transporter n=1 Tax=Weissella fermenti TaxID=2987699 RepID=A0ABT6D244_9LACO|nr:MULTISPECIES: MFS transporter [Weissella]MBJ7689425.1 MFS transporter [Weissella confusa]MCW0927129.1 MFS transporter [Weissella sp. LMG 11983]MDF9299570.1 MFS transporter [Weissella sp. BK2]